MLTSRVPCVQYMDRIYVKHQNKTQVNQLGLDLWRDVVVRNKRIRERLRSTLLGLVHRERTGEVIDRALMRNITMVRGLASGRTRTCQREDSGRLSLAYASAMCCRQHQLLGCTAASLPCMPLPRLYSHRRVPCRTAPRSKMS